MAIYLKDFENHNGYEAVEDDLILPNVSYCEEQR